MLSTCQRKWLMPKTLIISQDMLAMPTPDTFKALVITQTDAGQP
jgi:hypothetical protein